MDAAEAIEDPQARGSALRAIEHAFSEERCYGDFGRKLYLIQRVIHGVDIQPVATQITKLRFFISLIVEQQPTSDPANNYGLDPLPNLETNFIAANSLLGMERPAQAELRSTEVSRLEERLKRLRRQWFDAHDRGAKWELRKKDERLRGELREALIEDEWSETAANALSAWRPYDQNASADWLDPEWMFGVKDGFDVVIGNPPYVRADFPDPAHQELRQRVVDSDRYETLWEKWDLYIPFIERGFRLLREGGVITFIVSDAYCHAKYAEKSQEWFLRHARILRLDFLSRIRIFDAAVRNVTFVFQKTNGVQNKPQRRVHHGEFGNVKLLTTDEQRRLTHRAFFPEDTIEHRFSRPTVTLDEVGYVSVGLVAHADEKRVPGAFQLADLVSDTPRRRAPVGIVPWHSLRGVRNRSIKRQTRYRDEKPRRPDLPRREDLEETSARFAVQVPARCHELRCGPRVPARQSTEQHPPLPQRLEEAARSRLQREGAAARRPRRRRDPDGKGRRDPSADVEDLEGGLEGLVRRLYGLGETGARTPLA